MAPVTLRAPPAAPPRGHPFPEGPGDPPLINSKHQLPSGGGHRDQGSFRRGQPQPPRRGRRVDLTAATAGTARRAKRSGAQGAVCRVTGPGRSPCRFSCRAQSVRRKPAQQLGAAPNTSQLKKKGVFFHLRGPVLASISPNSSSPPAFVCFRVFPKPPTCTKAL